MMQQLLNATLQQYAGDRDAGLLPHGRGCGTFISGQVYDGDWQHGHMQGHGSIAFPDGLRYTGSFASDSISGSGVYEWEGAAYEGDVLDGVRHGHGKLSVRGSEAVYEGQWQHGKRHGRGVLFYSADRTAYYDGDWSNDMKHGHGTSVYPSGNCYTGEWVEDQRQGQGSMVWATQRQRYTGQWHAGLPDGPGEHIWEQQRPAAGLQGTNHAMNIMHNRYVGLFKAGQRHGQGTIFYSSGARYEGEWQWGKKHGQGVYVFEDGNVFSGQFLDDRPVLASGAVLGAASTLAAPGSDSDSQRSGACEAGGQNQLHSTGSPSQPAAQQSMSSPGPVTASASKAQPQKASKPKEGAKSSTKTAKPHAASPQQSQPVAAGSKQTTSELPAPAASTPPTKRASTAASGTSAASSNLSRSGNQQAPGGPAGASSSSNAPPGFGPSTSVMQLYIADLLVEYEGRPAAVYKALSNLVILYNTELRLLYDRYSACPSPLLDSAALDHSWALQACQLWEMLREAGLLCRHVSLQLACSLVAAATTPPPAVLRHRQQLSSGVQPASQGLCSPGTQLTFRDFCEVLVRLAAARYPMLQSLEAQLQQVITHHLLPLLGPNVRPATAGRSSMTAAAAMAAATAPAAAAAAGSEATSSCEQLLRSPAVVQYLKEHAGLLQQLWTAITASQQGQPDVPGVLGDTTSSSVEAAKQQQQPDCAEAAGPAGPCSDTSDAAVCSTAAVHVRQVLAALQLVGVLDQWQLSPDSVAACLLHSTVAGTDPQGTRAYIEDAASEASYSPEHSSGGANSSQEAALAATRALQQELGFWLDAPVLLQDFVWGLVRLSAVQLAVHPATQQQAASPARAGPTQARQQGAALPPQQRTPGLPLPPQQQQHQQLPLQSEQQPSQAKQAVAVGTAAAGVDPALQAYRELFLEGCRDSQGPAAVAAALQAMLEGPNGLCASVLGRPPHNSSEQEPPSGEATPLESQGSGQGHDDVLGVEEEGSAAELSVLEEEQELEEADAEDDGADTGGEEEEDV